MSDALDVVTLGEAMVLLVADQPGPLQHAHSFTKRTAGAETNVAIGLARLGMRVGWQSRLGDDSMGRYLRDQMAGEGIDCSRLELQASQRSGFMFKGRVDDGSDPPIEYHRRGSAASLFGPQDLDLPWLTSARHLHVTGVYAALTPSTLAATQALMAAMRAAGRSISFDPNLRPALWPSAEVMRSTINALASHSDWVLPGLSEGRLLTGRDTAAEIAEFYRTNGASKVIIKLGEQGAWYADAQAAGQIPAWPVPQVIDTVGAGDGFAVGVISALLAGETLAAAAQRGAWIGARAVQVRGDTEGLPTLAELHAAGFSGMSRPTKR